MVSELFINGPLNHGLVKKYTRRRFVHNKVKDAVKILSAIKSLVHEITGPLNGPVLS